MTTKEKVLLESLKLFSKKGYDAVGVEEIANAVGIKAPSIYKHYKGKKDIFIYRYAFGHSKGSQCLYVFSVGFMQSDFHFASLCCV